MSGIKKYFIGFLLMELLIPAFGQTSGTLNFSCKTSAPSGNWGTKHVVAVWIQNNANPSVFVKTDAKYGNEDDHLTSWVAISGKNLVDATTGAAPSTYENISVSWNGTDVSKNVVMDGDYSNYIEMGWGKDKVADHAVTSFSFTKGPEPQQLAPTGTTNYSNVSISWEPVTTIVNALEDPQGICQFSNPVEEKINLNFIKELTNVKLSILNIAGVSVYSDYSEVLPAGVKTIDLSDLKSGLYLISIKSLEYQLTYKVLLK